MAWESPHSFFRDAQEECGEGEFGHRAEKGKGPRHEKSQCSVAPLSKGEEVRQSKQGDNRHDLLPMALQ